MDRHLGRGTPVHLIWVNLHCVHRWGCQRAQSLSTAWQNPSTSALYTLIGYSPFCLSLCSRYKIPLQHPQAPAGDNHRLAPYAPPGFDCRFLCSTPTLDRPHYLVNPRPTQRILSEERALLIDSHLNRRGSCLVCDTGVHLLWKLTIAWDHLIPNAQPVHDTFSFCLPETNFKFVRGIKFEEWRMAKPKGCWNHCLGKGCIFVPVLCLLNLTNGWETRSHLSSAFWQYHRT